METVKTTTKRNESQPKPIEKLLSTPPPVSAEDTSIERIREILFGRRAKEFEHQVIELRSQYEAEIQAMRTEYSSRLKDMESFFEDESKNLMSRIKLEHEGWEKAANNFNATIDETRQMTLGRIHALSEELHSEQHRFLSQIRKDLSFLEEKKVNRTQFIELLNDWALRLNDDKEDEVGTKK